MPPISKMGLFWHTVKFLAIQVNLAIAWKECFRTRCDFGMRNRKPIRTIAFSNLRLFKHRPFSPSSLQCPRVSLSFYECVIHWFSTAILVSTFSAFCTITLLRVWNFIRFFCSSRISSITNDTRWNIEDAIHVFRRDGIHTSRASQQRQGCILQFDFAKQCSFGQNSQ